MENDKMKVLFKFWKKNDFKENEQQHYGPLTGLKTGQAMDL